MPIELENNKNKKSARKLFSLRYNVARPLEAMIANSSKTSTIDGVSS